ncbi:Ig-like domain-containing protein [Cytobacillus suaedae]|nr:Ig-like domain-containing protein [Cytobacillus suaedae]
MINKYLKTLILTPITILFVLGVLFIPTIFSMTENELPLQTTTDSKKEWTVSFNMEVHPSTVSSNTIYIIDERDKKVPTKLSVDKNGQSVVIAPIRSYKEGTRYYLFIKESLRSERKLFLNKDTIMPFEHVKDEKNSKKKENETKATSKDKESKLTISVKHHTYLSELKATSIDNSISKILIGNNEMHYDGDNKYSLNLAGVKSGDKLSIKAYNSDNRIVERLTYEVE